MIIYNFNRKFTLNPSAARRCRALHQVVAGALRSTFCPGTSSARSRDRWAKAASAHGGQGTSVGSYLCGRPLKMLVGLENLRRSLVVDRNCWRCCRRNRRRLQSVRLCCPWAEDALAAASALRSCPGAVQSYARVAGAPSHAGLTSLAPGRRPALAGTLPRHRTPAEPMLPGLERDLPVSPLQPRPCCFLMNQ